MKINYIRIENILGLTSMELAPGGTLTEISGDNGLGKTSILEAIKAATQGGHDATLLRHGAEKGQIVLVLDDGTELHKNITASKSTLDLIKDGKKIPRPADVIKGLTDLLSVNPVEFLTAPKKDRVKVLLEAMPILIDTDKLAAITNIPVSAQEGLNGLALIDIIRQEVFEDRTGTNRAVKEKEGSIHQLTLAMPDLPGGVEGDEDELQRQLDTARETRDAETARIDSKLKGIRTDSAAKVLAIKTAGRDAVALATQETQSQIDAINVAMNARIATIRAADQTSVETELASCNDTEGKAGRVRQRALDMFVATAEPINATLGAIRANRNTFAKREQTKVMIQQMDTELVGLIADAARQTEALDEIDQYKSDLLNNLPIPGLEVKDGEVFRNGVAFDRLNTAQQVDIAIEIAKLRAGTLSIACIDRFECLSPDTFTEFKKRAEQSDLQLFITRVEPGQLTIRTQ